MPLAGVTLLPRAVTMYASAHWEDNLDLVKQGATCLSESQASVGAWHDNPNKYRDCGLMQISIPPSEVGGGVEHELRTTSDSHSIFEPVVKHNLAAAWDLYSAPGPNDGIRKWEPWFGYTLGWAMFPSWWIWHSENGKHIGPWMPTGRYVHRAIVGVANYRFLIEQSLNASEAVALAGTLAAAFQVEGDFKLMNGIVEWYRWPEEPVQPPKDGIGPQPVPNGGA